MKHPALWLVIGIMVGLLCAMSVRKRDRFYMNEQMPLVLLDKETGKTWRYTASGWIALTNRSED